jgi:hypothetical protein
VQRAFRASSISESRWADTGSAPSTAALRVFVAPGLRKARDDFDLGVEKDEQQQQHLHSAPTGSSA